MYEWKTFVYEILNETKYGHEVFIEAIEKFLQNGCNHLSVEQLHSPPQRAHHGTSENIVRNKLLFFSTNLPNRWKVRV